MLPEAARRRRAAVMIPLCSVRGPSGWGLGEIPDIPRFARWANAAGFQILQLLPTHEVRGGETSPYAAATAFALDPVYLGLDDCEDFVAAGGRAALPPDERERLDRLVSAKTVVWAEVRALKSRALLRAFSHFFRREWREGGERARAFARFREQRAAWLEDYALYAVLHDRYRKRWLEWPRALRERAPKALDAARRRHARSLLYQQWLQWQIDEQWQRARALARALGVELMGDLPFVVGGDSADAWSHRQVFRLDLKAGAPPDDFSVSGQDWGLPVYDWEALERSGFAWMRARAARAAELYALYRVDHVIGLYRTYFRSVDGKRAGFLPEDEAAQIRLGETVLGLFAASCEIVAEDLGTVPRYLRPSLTNLGIPGYKILRWEKAGATEAGTASIEYRDPASWPELSVAATGTHDIETQADWYDALAEAERGALARLPGLERLAGKPAFDEEVRDRLLEAVYAAPSGLLALPFQDALGLRERINVPGTVSESNWSYRTPMDLAQLTADRTTTERLAALSRRTRRGG